MAGVQERNRGLCDAHGGIRVVADIPYQSVHGLDLNPSYAKKSSTNRRRYGEPDEALIENGFV